MLGWLGAVTPDVSWWVSESCERRPVGGVGELSQVVADDDMEGPFASRTGDPSKPEMPCVLSRRV